MRSESKPDGLVPVPLAALSTSGIKSLAVRGRSLLHNEEEAESWLRKGLELQEGAPADPWAINPNFFGYSNQTLSANLRTNIPGYIRDVSRGTSPKRAAKIRSMTPDDQEMAYIAHFFVQEVLDRIANGPPELGRRISNDASTSLGKNPIPSPAGMDDGILTKATAEKLGQILHELGELEKDEPRKVEQFKQRETDLSEAYRCFEKGYELDPLNPELVYCLAKALLLGTGCHKHELKSVELLQKAAAFGHAVLWQPWEMSMPSVGSVACRRMKRKLRDGMKLPRNTGMKEPFA